ncbi:MAG: hypothetical protein HC890_11465 [Chloroflexaceae bacterium]|nr:hypothetical protein [Chloroflexaceae bacterium]
MSARLSIGSFARNISPVRSPSQPHRRGKKVIFSLADPIVSLKNLIAEVPDLIGKLRQVFYGNHSQFLSNSNPARLKASLTKL